MLCHDNRQMSDIKFYMELTYVIPPKRFFNMIKIIFYLFSRLMLLNRYFIAICFGCCAAKAYGKRIFLLVY